MTEDSYRSPEGRWGREEGRASQTAALLRCLGWTLVSGVVYSAEVVPEGNVKPV